MFYEYVSNGQAQQWAEAMRASEDVTCVFAFKHPIEVEDDRGGYDYAVEMEVHYMEDEDGFWFEWYNDEGEKLAVGSYDYETALMLMQQETAAGNGADCDLDYLDNIIDG